MNVFGESEGEFLEERVHHIGVDMRSQDCLCLSCGRTGSSDYVKIVVLDCCQKSDPSVMKGEQPYFGKETYHDKEETKTSHT